MYSVVYSIVFLISIVVIFYGLLLFKKTDKKLNLVLAIPLYFFVLLLTWVFICGLLNMISVPINILSISIINYIIGAFLISFSKIKHKQQEYYFRKYDLICMLVVVAIAVIIGLVQFGVKLIPNYDTTDPAIHLRMANDTIESQYLSGQYFSALTNSVLMSFCMGFAKSFWAYKFFVLSDILLFVLSSCTMYVALRTMMKTCKRAIIALILAIVYSLGYPLTNMAFGFCYLGIGVNVCVFIIVVINLFLQNILLKRTTIICLLLACTGVMVSYSLFAPIIFIAIALFIVYYFVKQKKLLTWDFFHTELKIFLIPCLIGVYYIYLNVFQLSISAASGAIAAEGYIYRELYSAFLMLLPFVVYAILLVIKTKKFEAVHFVFFALAVYMAYLFCQGMNGNVSSYYYFKTYFLMWAVCFILSGIAINDLLNVSKKALLSYTIVWIFLAGMNFSKLDEKITGKNNLFSPYAFSTNLFSLYNFNFSAIISERFDENKIDLYENAYNCITEDSKIPLVDTLNPVYWYEAFTKQSLSEYYVYDFDSINVEEYQKLILDNCDYFVAHIDYRGEFYDMVSNGELMYINSAGELIRINR